MHGLNHFKFIIFFSPSVAKDEISVLLFLKRGKNHSGSHVLPNITVIFKQKRTSSLSQVQKTIWKFCLNKRLVQVKVKGYRSLYGAFQHCGRSAYCILTHNKFPHSSLEAPRIIQMRETSTSEGGNYYQ